MENTWYKLDNAAKIYPAIKKEDWAPIFRVAAILKNEVNPVLLQSALLMTYKRFPTFSVRINRGLFWYYFEPNEPEPEVMLENTYPTCPFSKEKDKGYLFRVLYYKKRISLEVFHSITDGFGATVFLKTLLFNYFTIINGKEPIANLSELGEYGILYYKDLPTPEEIEDSFQYFASKSNGLKLHENPAFKILGARIGKNSVRITHILLSTKAVYKLAKEFACTVTEFLTSLFIHSILNSRVYSASDKRPVKISVPVNLRKRFSSKTMRNFSSYINIEVFPEDNIGKVDFKEICAIVRNQIKEGTEVDILRNKFSSNVNAERNIMMRIAPLFIKNIVLKSTFSLYGERLTTSTLSNIGSIVLPGEMADLVDRFDLVIGAPKQNAMNCGVISFKDTLSVSFTSIISENSILKKFVDFLVGHELGATVETNY